MKLCIITILLIINLQALYAQKPVKEFNRAYFSAADSLLMLNNYGNNKQLPKGYELPALIALSYFPELKNTHITFIVKPAYSLLQTRPVGHGIFNRKTRRYTITISDSTFYKLDPIKMSNMGFNAQIGVLGHELSHASDFTRRSFVNLTASGIKHISSRYIDRFEYKTDSLCIAHGLGYQLLAWSKFVRSALHTSNYDGADNINKPMMHERYMNPNTIEEHIKGMGVYKE